MMDVKLKKLRDNAVIPTYGTDRSAGFDLHSCKTCSLRPGERRIVPTGWAFEFPYDEWHAKYTYHLSIRPRSGLAIKHGITVLNTPGLCDADYRGEVCVIMINHGHENYLIKTGDKIAQGVIELHKRVTEFEVVEELSDTERGEGGFGSTGK